MSREKNGEKLCALEMQMNNITGRRKAKNAHDFFARAHLIKTMAVHKMNYQKVTISYSIDAETK